MQMDKKPRYINANDVKWASVPVPGVGNIKIPNIDATKTAIVLCEDCIYTEEVDGQFTCGLWGFSTDRYSYCAKGRLPMEGEIHGD